MIKGWRGMRQPLQKLPSYFALRSVLVLPSFFEPSLVPFFFAAMVSPLPRGYT